MTRLTSTCCTSPYAAPYIMPSECLNVFALAWGAAWRGLAWRSAVNARLCTSTSVSTVKMSQNVVVFACKLHGRERGGAAQCCTLWVSCLLPRWLRYNSYSTGLSLSNKCLKVDPRPHSAQRTQPNLFQYGEGPGLFLAVCTYRLQALNVRKGIENLPLSKSVQGRSQTRTEQGFEEGAAWVRV